MMGGPNATDLAEGPPSAAMLIFIMESGGYATGLGETKKGRLTSPDRSTYRLEYWKRARAPRCPYFFLSFFLGSRVINPAFFKISRNLSLYNNRALEIPCLTAPA